MKRLITRMNKMKEGNIQPLHVGKLVSAFHSACNPVNVIAFFRNAEILLHMESTGVVACYVDEYQHRCLLHHFEAPIAPIEVRQHDGDTDEIDDTTEPIVPIWLQILEQEAAQMLGEDEQ
jgi:hypothetical protein